MSRVMEFGEPEVIGVGEDLGVRWTLLKQPMLTEDGTIDGLFIKTDDGFGGGGGGSRGFDPSPGFLRVRMSSLSPGLVAVYGPMLKRPPTLRVEVEFADGTTGTGQVVRSPASYEVDFFFVIVDRRPLRLTVKNEYGGQWGDIDGQGFRYREPD